MRGSREFMGVKDGLRDFLVAKYGINKILLGIDMGLMGCGGLSRKIVVLISFISYLTGYMITLSIIVFFPAGFILSGNIIVLLQGGKTCLNSGNDSQL